ncbi:twin-arginine translocase TatA/TatE family subunit [Candidatus Woesebacteria bacterium]|nr:twin-arginine translocase TatA/TatE family subunit [Candidatus Woesebacteria bacterium]
MFGFLKNLGPTEIIILAVILILLFGAKAFKSLAKTAGQSFKEMKNIKKNFTDAVEDGDKKSKE